jgi:hypothetical protein
MPKKHRDKQTEDVLLQILTYVAQALEKVWHSKKKKKKKNDETEEGE